jgi:hypothetical protein
MSLFITYDVFKIAFDENWMFEMFVDIKNSFCFIFFKSNNIFEFAQSNLNTYLYQSDQFLDSRISMNLYTKFTSIYPPNNANNTWAIRHK